MTWVQTYGRKQFFFDKVEEYKFDIEEIAHALSNLCRFNGHTNEFYSVAQHCVLVAEYCSREHKLSALMHDAAEAFIGDMVRPIKVELKAYLEYEERLNRALAKHYRYTYPFSRGVKHADDVLLATEARDLLGGEVAPWHVNELPLAKLITPWKPAFAEDQFIQAFEDYSGLNDKIVLITRLDEEIDFEPSLTDTTTVRTADLRMLINAAKGAYELED